MIALSRLSLTIPGRVGKNEQQLCTVATTDTFPRFTSPEPGTRSVSWCRAMGYRNGRSVPNPVGCEEPKGRCCCGRFVMSAIMLQLIDVSNIVSAI